MRIIDNFIDKLQRNCFRKCFGNIRIIRNLIKCKQDMCIKLIDACRIIHRINDKKKKRITQNELSMKSINYDLKIRV